jgi:hypothetical protein
MIKKEEDYKGYYRVARMSFQLLKEVYLFYSRSWKWWDRHLSKPRFAKGHLYNL